MKKLKLLWCVLSFIAATKAAGEGFAVMLRKIVHENGLKEFTISKEIKRNNCSCMCACVPKNFGAKTTFPTASAVESRLTSHAAADKQYFKIAKEIRKNKCSCSCICVPIDKRASYPPSSTHQTTQAISLSTTSSTITTLAIDDVSKNNLISTAKLIEELLRNTPSFSELPSVTPFDSKQDATTTTPLKLDINMTTPATTETTTFATTAVNDKEGISSSSVVNNTISTENFTDTKETTAMSLTPAPTKNVLETPATLSPVFKAKVANLLNRLKEQLIKLRAQEAGTTTSTPAVDIVERTVAPTSQDTIQQESLLKMKSLLEGLKRKVEIMKIEANNDEMNKSISLLDKIENEHFTTTNTENDNSNVSSVSTDAMKLTEFITPTTNAVQTKTSAVSMAATKESIATTVTTTEKSSTVTTKPITNTVTTITVRPTSTKAENTIAVIAMTESAMENKTVVDKTLSIKNELETVKQRQDSLKRNQTEFNQLLVNKLTTPLMTSTKDIQETTSENISPALITTTTEAKSMSTENVEDDYTFTTEDEENDDSVNTKTEWKSSSTASTTDSSNKEESENDKTTSSATMSSVNTEMPAKTSDMSQTEVSVKNLLENIEQSQAPRLAKTTTVATTITTRENEDSSRQSFVVDKDPEKTFTDSTTTSVAVSTSDSTTLRRTSTGKASEQHTTLTLTTIPTATSKTTKINPTMSEDSEMIAFVTEAVNVTDIVNDSKTTTTPQQTTMATISSESTTFSSSFENEESTNIPTSDNIEILATTSTATTDEKSVIRLLLTPMSADDLKMLTASLSETESVTSAHEITKVKPIFSTTQQAIISPNMDNGANIGPKTKIFLRPFRPNTFNAEFVKSTSIVPSTTTIIETTDSPATTINENNIENLENSLANRLEQARKLREEQHQLEMLNEVGIESTADTETAQEIHKRRKAIEARLAQLAQTERWHRELIQRYQLRQRALANANAAKNVADIDKDIEDQTIRLSAISSETEPTLKPTKTVRISCDPVRKFIATFRVRDPIAWLRENCAIIKQLHPTASCPQIQQLLSGCF